MQETRVLGQLQKLKELQQAKETSAAIASGGTGYMVGALSTLALNDFAGGTASGLDMREAWDSVLAWEASVKRSYELPPAQIASTPWIEVINGLNYVIDVRHRYSNDVTIWMEKVQPRETRRIDSFQRLSKAAIWALGAFRNEAVVWWDKKDTDNARYTVSYAGESDYVRVKHEAFTCPLASGDKPHKIDFYEGDRPISFREGID